MTTCFYGLKFFIELSTPLIDMDGAIEYSRKRIFMKYLKSYMVVDVITCFPVLTDQK